MTLWECILSLGYVLGVLAMGLSAMGAFMWIIAGSGRIHNVVCLALLIIMLIGFAGFIGMETKSRHGEVNVKTLMNTMGEGDH